MCRLSPSSLEAPDGRPSGPGADEGADTVGHRDGDPARASWRRPERSSGRPVIRPTAIPPAASAAAVIPSHAGKAPEQVREQRDERAEGERGQRRGPGQHRGRQAARSTPSSSLVCTSSAVSGSRETAPAIRAAVSRRHRSRGSRPRLVLLERGNGLASPLQVDLGVEQLVLIGDRHVFPGPIENAPRPALPRRSGPPCAPGPRRRRRPRSSDAFVTSRRPPRRPWAAAIRPTRPGAGATTAPGARRHGRYEPAGISSSAT